MATQPDQLSRSIASAVSRAVERAVDQALASLPSLPGNSGFAPATQEVCNIDVSLLKHPSHCRGDDLCVDVINKKIFIDVLQGKVFYREQCKYLLSQNFVPSLTPKVARFTESTATIDPGWILN